MKIFYNSTLAKWLTPVKDVATIMLFGAVFTEAESLPYRSRRHEHTHVLQYKDFLMLGLFIDIVAAFILFACNIVSWWMLLLLLIPLLLFYVVYGVEYLWKLHIYGKDTYQNVSFEREAYAKMDDPCYNGVRVSFSNFKYLRK